MEIFLIILGIILAVLTLLFSICGFIYNQIVWRKTIKIPQFITNLLAGNDMSLDNYDEDAYKAEAILMPRITRTEEYISDNGEKLIARIIEPQKNNGRLILACHGARSWGIGEFCFISDYFYKNGYTVIMPDHRGCGDSDGKYMGYGTHESIDTYYWVNYAKQHYPDLDIFLMGVSMGAATVLMMSKNAEDHAIKGIIADCSYTSAWDEFSYQLRKSFHLPDFPILNICNLYSRIIADYSFKDASPLNAVKEAKKPILFIHGGKDDFVPTYMEKILYDACCTEKEMLVVENAIHARSYYTDPIKYQKAIESFMDKYSKTKSRV